MLGADRPRVTRTCFPNTLWPVISMAKSLALIASVEVKYRANGSFSIDDVKGDYPWPHAYFIVVSKEHIKCLTYKQLAAGKAITPECNNLLIVRKDLDLDRTLIVDYGRMARKFFARV